MNSALSILFCWLFALCFLAAPGLGKNGEPLTWVTVRFPDDHSMGNLFLVTRRNQMVSKPTLNTPKIPMRGTFRLPAHRPLSLSLNRLDDEDGPYLDQLSSVEVVKVDVRNVESVSDDTMRHLSKLTTVCNLIVNGADITDKSLAYLRSMTTLSSISMEGTLIEGPGFAYLKDLPGLETLAAGNSSLKPVAFSNLVACKALRNLRLNNALVTDEDLVYIGKMKDLVILDLARNKIRNSGLAHLAGLKNLFLIDLSDTFVTAGCVATLKTLPHLGVLTLAVNQLSPAELKQLRSALPHCQIIFNQQKRVERELFDPLH